MAESQQKNAYKSRIFDILERTGALQFGDFILASGAKSKYYIDLRLIPSFPEEFATLVAEAKNYLERHHVSFEGIAAIPLAAMPFGTLLAFQMKKPFYILRKEPKRHGLQKLVEGVIQQGQKILLVDDLISSGFSKVFALQALRAEGAVVTDMFVFIDRTSNGLAAFEREHNIKVHYLISAKEILTRASK